jgi:prolyl oligopeptidase
MTVFRSPVRYGSTPFSALLTTALLATGSAISQETARPAADGDPWLWLEEVEDRQALAWAEARNADTAERLAELPLFGELYSEALEILGGASRIPAVSQRGAYLYNFWQDAERPRGLLRRTTLDSYRQTEPEWETVLDLDALAGEEGVLWAYGGMTCLPPEHRHCLILLSPGGTDAVEVREYDMASLQPVAEGFHLPAAKLRVEWRDESSIFVGTDFGPDSMTDSGYPRIVKLWQRGTPLDEAPTVHEGDSASVAVQARRLRDDGENVDLVAEATTFWTTVYHQLVDGELVRLGIPETARVVDVFEGRLILWLRDDWTIGGDVHPAGGVVAATPAALRGSQGDVERVVSPTESEVVEDVEVAPNGVLVTMLDDVRGRLYRYEPGAARQTSRTGGGNGGHGASGSPNDTPEAGWTRRAVPLPDNGAVHVASVHDETGDFFVEFESFLTPPALYYVPADDPVPEQVKAQEATFDGSRFEVSQHWTTSADGTEVPYFVVAPREIELDGSHPVWMFSYGGFEVALTPSYSGSYEPLYGAYGKLWLERGGVFVLANIRGGGEFGPGWHQAALKEHRYKSFEDFEAVARDLFARGITTPERLGIEGRSNGGLLVAATMLRHPELYGAVVCGVPLLDMGRYHRLLAGASWMGEFGNPDLPEEWAYIGEYSPYQNLEPDRGLPPIFFYTSTRDDRVHPGHMRKMAARMLDMGYAVEYYENTEGGHSGSSTPDQLARRIALSFTFLWQELGSGDDGATP